MHEKKTLFYLTMPLESAVIFILSAIRHQAYGHSDVFLIANLPSPHWLLFPTSSKGSFICTFPQTGQPLMDQLWTTNAMENSLNCKCICCAGSSRWSKPLWEGALLPELHPAPPGNASRSVWKSQERTQSWLFGTWCPAQHESICVVGCD